MYSYREYSFDNGGMAVLLHVMYMSDVGGVSMILDSYLPQRVWSGTVQERALVKSGC